METGIKNTCAILVGKKDTASAVASGLAEVLATPVMIALMEKTAYTLVQPFMEEGCSTVGTAISVKHMAATPVGMTVRAIATLTGIDGRRLVFSIEAFDEAEKIGEATHERFIVKNEKFLAKAYGKSGK